MMFLTEYSEIGLGEFNQEFFDSIDDNQYIKGPALGGEQYFHTILVDGLPAGIVGYLPPKNVSLADTGFVQILLKPEYRGRSLTGKIYDLLVERHELKTLYATISENNQSSIKAHQKIGFHLLSTEKMADLRQRGLLDKDKFRLVDPRGFEPLTFRM